MNTVTLLQKFMGQGGTPQQLLEKTALQNPMLKNLISMAKQGNTQGVETFARNLFKEQGRDFDKEFTEFRNSFK